MKWRQSLIYLLILLSVGGYFYYFEVVKKEEKQTAEKEARKVFRAQADSIKALEIISKDKKAVKLKNEAQWKILEPVQADTDKGALEGFLHALSNLELEKEIAAAPQDLKPYGLQEPVLKIRFETGGQWQELILGDKNPIGGGYYARTADKPNVILIAGGNWATLNKGLDELRKKELFSFQPNEVAEIQMTWQDGSDVHLERTEGGIGWKAPEQPDIKIKTGKVDNVLEQIQWLRAQSFIENAPASLEAQGLQPPEVTVKLRLKENRNVGLLLGKKDEEKHQVTAVSTELPGVVEIEAGVLEEIPRNVSALEDRSIFGVKSEEVKEVKWRLGETQGNAVRTDEKTWALRHDGSDPKPMKDSWHVKSLLWDLGDAEYTTKLSPVPAVPEQPHGRLECLNGEKSLVTLSWGKPSEGDDSVATVWIDRGGEPEAVRVKAETIDRLEQDLNRILQPGQEKGGAS